MHALRVHLAGASPIERACMHAGTPGDCPAPAGLWPTGMHACTRMYAHALRTITHACITHACMFACLQSSHWHACMHAHALCTRWFVARHWQACLHACEPRAPAVGSTSSSSNAALLSSQACMQASVHIPRAGSLAFQFPGRHQHIHLSFRRSVSCFVGLHACIFARHLYLHPGRDRHACMHANSQPTRLARMHAHSFPSEPQAMHAWMLPSASICGHTCSQAVRIAMHACRHADLHWLACMHIHPSFSRTIAQNQYAGLHACMPSAVRLACMHACTLDQHRLDSGAGAPPRAPA